MIHRFGMLVALWLMVACGLVPSGSAPANPPITTGMISRSMGDPNAPIKMQEFSDYQ
jgi:hypothetical protein